MLSEVTGGEDPDYDPATIEARWQAAWKAAGEFATPPAKDTRPAGYVFAGCPSASGPAHVGHMRGYAIGDAYARFLRARGYAVLFSLGFNAFGSSVELEALGRGLAPEEWARSCAERLRGQLERLGCSCDWERSFLSSDPDHYRWTQLLFLAMLKAGLVYRPIAQAPWLMRIGARIQASEDGLEDLSEWDGAAIESQREAIGRVDGVEVEASTFDGATLTVFTPFGEAIAQATFVAVSPFHPDVGRWSSQPEVAARLATAREAGWRHEERDGGRVPVVQTDGLASVPGAPGMLPIVISPLVDARYGPTAALGIPDLDAADRSIAEHLPPLAGVAWKGGKSAAAARPAVRYRARDLPISRQRAWGAPVPLIHCPDCGEVPVALEELPVRLPRDLQPAGDGNSLRERADFVECACPRCRGAARRETETLDRRLDEMWMWAAICVPPEGRGQAMLSHPDLQRWLPAKRVVWGADAGERLFDQRLLGRALQDLDELPPLPQREPFAGVTTHQMVLLDGRRMSRHGGEAVDAGELVERVGADTVRLAVLHAAAPGKAFNWSEQPVRHCQKFLQGLHGYAEPRLRAWDGAEAPESDASDRLRRQLARWCGIAVEKITAAYEGLEMQRVVHNVMLLSRRIEDFEQRAIEQRGELEPRDREAIVAALLELVQVLAPLAPHIAEELWSAGGHQTLVSATPWPAEPLLTDPKLLVGY